MKTWRVIIIGLTVTLAATGCFQKRVVWSPDGSWAAVLVEDEDSGSLHLCDPDGTLSEVLLDNVVMAEWLPDSKRLLLCRTEKRTDWGGMTELMPSDQEERLTWIARELLSEVKTLEDWNKKRSGSHSTGGKV